MNALKHMEVIFAGVLVIGCVLALMPPQQATPRGSVAAPIPVPMPVVVITGKRPAPAKHAAQPTESPMTTAAR